MVFVTVNHGACEQTLFNQDCRSITLLNAIREKCSLDSSDVIDLSDREGNVKDLRRHPNMRAKDVLADREDVILLRVGENDKGKLVYTPLLESDEIVTKAFLERLAKGSKLAAKTGTSKSTGGKSHQHQHQLQHQASQGSTSGTAHGASSSRRHGGGDAATSSASSVAQSGKRSSLAGHKSRR